MAMTPVTEAKRLAGKTVLVRIDADVPLEGKRVLDDSRLRACLPTLRYLERKHARIVLLGHLGRPGGKPDRALSLKPIGHYLGKLLRQPVHVLPLELGVRAIKAAAQRGVVLLENVRFYPGEGAGEVTFAKTIAKLGQLYVNEAFSVAHRRDASVAVLPKLLPAYAGLSLAAEVAALVRVQKAGAKPVVAVIGGAKVADKLPVISKLLPRLKAVLVGGGVANTLLAAKKLSVGRSLVGSEELTEARKLLRRAGKKLVLPVDVVVDKVSTKRHEAALRPTRSVRPGERIVDVGTETCRLYAGYLKEAATVFWSGPLGLVEEPSWRHATLALGRLVASQARRRTYVVVGGGDTAAFFHQHGLHVDYVSSGGGAMLAFLAGEVLPGLKALGYRQAR